MISKCGKFKVMFLSVAHPTKTTRGTTNREICVHDPTATVAKFSRKRGEKDASVGVNTLLD